MSKIILAPLAVALLGAALTASASPIPADFTLNFSGVANLANVARFYNGGTDSAGYRGHDYGVSFGGTVHLNENGPYVSGPAHMSFAANLFGDNVAFFIKFNAARNDVDGGLSYIFGSNYSDTARVAGNANPYCGSEASCVAGGYNYIHPSEMGGYMFYADGINATDVIFNTDRLDNIQFVKVGGPESSLLPARIRGNPPKLVNGVHFSKLLSIFS